MGKTVKDMALAARAQITLLAPDEVQTRVAAPAPPLVIDVREPGEYERGHIPGAINIPRGVIELKADLEHPMRDARLAERSQPVVTYCMGGLGARSALAAQALQEMGFTNVACLDGGLQAWKEQGKPVEQ